MIDDVLKANRDLVCEAGVTKSVGAVEIMNSNGGQAGYERSTFSMALHGTLIRGTDMLFVGDWASSCRPDLDPDAITQRVIRQLALAIETAAAPSGEMPVLFTPRGAASPFVSPPSTRPSWRAVLLRVSQLQGKLGQQLLDQRISIWDDPTVPLRPGSRGVDDEGVPTRRTTLFDHGVPTAFLYDLQTAGQAGAESTGSGSRGLGSLPAPSTSVILVDVGETPNDDIIRGIDDGPPVAPPRGAGPGNGLGARLGGAVRLAYWTQYGRT